jgi:DNA primase
VRGKDLAEAIKRAVSMRDAAARYGFEVNRVGFMKCPLHSGDHTASFKIYPDGRGWYCYGCNQGGDVISFAQKLYDLSCPQALLRIDSDFNLGLSGQKVTPEVSALVEQRKAEEEERKQRKARYDEEWLKSIELTKEIDELSGRTFELLCERDKIDLWLDQHEDWNGKK